ncbi:MAG: efflux RND transporter periplasmic adaptor subunit [Allosphingosinicella sp.]|uniref:efflux RND transporter periplasmic adaptor subunit n=1 Tax=Allosphingosinicella sp. TaxID=2823234 RepID=UPI0039396E97
MRIGKRGAALGLAAALGTASLGAWIFTERGDQAAAAAPTAPPRVPVAAVVVREVAPRAEFTGYLEATEAVDLAPRVGGQIISTAVPEGAMVRAGQVLFQLDRAPFLARVAAANAALATARASLAKAERDLARGLELVPKGFIPRRAVDDARTEVEQQSAAVRAAEAQLRQAELDLGFTQVIAPISGRVGRIEATRGNLVSGGDAAGATRLTRIVRVDPLHLYFDMDEATYLQLAPAGTGRAVQVALAAESGRPFAGRLDFVAPEADRGTGTVRVRAVVPNPTGELKPGLFARVRIDTGPSQPTTLVADEAIGVDQGRRFVLAVGSDGVAQYRAVQVGGLVDGLRVVESGLGSGDRIILKGLVRPGMEVEPQPTPMQSAAASTSTPAVR